MSLNRLPFNFCGFARSWCLFAQESRPAHRRSTPRTCLNLQVDELELELIQFHMAQKPVLRGEVGCACLNPQVDVPRNIAG